MNEKDVAEGKWRSDKRRIWIIALLIFCAVVAAFQWVHERTETGEIPENTQTLKSEQSMGTMGPANKENSTDAAAPAAIADKRPPEWTENQLIAHALGGIDGETYTNSYDAFVKNYAAGDRVFETDLILTSDDHLVARHDWGRDTSELLQPSLPDDEKDGPIPLADFMSAEIMGKYKPMDVDRVIQILHDYPDVFIVTDTKETDPERISRQFETIVEKANETDPNILERIIPELYSEEMIKQVQSIYSFPNYLFSLYLSSYSETEVENIVQHYGVRTVAMPQERVTPELIAGLNGLGVYAYVHTINDSAEKNKLNQLGVHGFYTDFLTPGGLAAAMNNAKPGKA